MSDDPVPDLMPVFDGHNDTILKLERAARDGVDPGGGAAAEHAFLATSSVMGSAVTAAGFLVPVAITAYGLGMLKDRGWPEWLATCRRAKSSSRCCDWTACSGPTIGSATSS